MKALDELKKRILKNESIINLSDWFIGSSIEDGSVRKKYEGIEKIYRRFIIEIIDTIPDNENTEASISHLFMSMAYAIMAIDLNHEKRNAEMKENIREELEAMKKKDGSIE